MSLSMSRRTVVFGLMLFVALVLMELLMVAVGYAQPPEEPPIIEVTESAPTPAVEPVPVEITPPVVVVQPPSDDWRSVAIIALAIVLIFLGRYLGKSAPPEVIQLLSPMIKAGAKVLEDYASTTPNQLDDAAAAEILKRIEELEKQVQKAGREVQGGALPSTRPAAPLQS